MKRPAQWHTVGFWRPGQEVELAPLFLIFSPKNSKMVNLKLISVIFKSDKQKTNKKKKKKKKKKKTKKLNKTKQNSPTFFRERFTRVYTAPRATSIQAP